MVLIFGGAYQGKRAFADERFNLTDSEICVVGDDFGVEKVSDGVRAVYGLHKWIRRLVEEGLDSDAKLEELLKRIDEKTESSERGAETGDFIVIMNDMSQGLVPMEEKERAFREANGRAMIRIAAEADEVYRVFCGIGTGIK